MERDYIHKQSINYRYDINLKTEWAAQNFNYLRDMNLVINSIHHHHHNQTQQSQTKTLLRSGMMGTWKSCNFHGPEKRKKTKTKKKKEKLWDGQHGYHVVIVMGWKEVGCTIVALKVLWECRITIMFKE